MRMNLSLISYKHCWVYEDCLKDGIVAGFTRPHIQDIRDMSLVLDELKVKAEVAYMHQVHSEIILWTDKEGRFCGDGLLTDSEGLMLVVKTADCMPVILYEKQGQNTGAIHMGWKSALKGILSNLPANLSDYRLVAGPALRPCCYEVGKEFLNYVPFEGCLTPREKSNLHQGPPKKGQGTMGEDTAPPSNKYTLDPVEFIKKNLFPRGLKEANFLESGICSYCSPLALPSYRRTKNKERIYSFIVRNHGKRE